MIRQQLFIGAALIAGVAIGYFVQPEPERIPVREEASPKRSAKPIEDKGDAAAIAALRARVRELEAQLAGRREEKGNERPQDGERRDVARREREHGPASPREWMEKMKKDDPAGYARMTNGIARWRQAQRDRQTVRMGYLTSVDTSRMSSSARKTHEAYQDLIARREAVAEKLQDVDLGEDERRATMDEMFSLDRELRETGAAERKILMEQIAGAVGLDGEAANELIQEVSDVYEVTEGRHGHGMPPPPNRQ